MRGASLQINSRKIKPSLWKSAGYRISFECFVRRRVSRLQMRWPSTDAALLCASLVREFNAGGGAAGELHLQVGTAHGLKGVELAFGCGRACLRWVKTTSEIAASLARELSAFMTLWGSVDGGQGRCGLLLRR